MGKQRALVPHVTTLADVYLEITEGIFPPIAFVVQREHGHIISYVTIMHCRFRDYPVTDLIMDIRSCDCEGIVCGHPVQHLYMSKTEMQHWYYNDTSGIKHTFAYTIPGPEEHMPNVTPWST